MEGNYNEFMARMVEVVYAAAPRLFTHKNIFMDVHGLNRLLRPGRFKGRYQRNERLRIIGTLL